MNTEPTEAHLQEACDLLNEQVSLYKWEMPTHRGNQFVVAIARYIANQQPAIAPELVERMLVIIRRAASHTFGEYVNEARAILAELDASKPDPLVEVIDEYRRTQGSGEYCTPQDRANAFRHALTARGLHITEIAK